MIDEGLHGAEDTFLDGAYRRMLQGMVFLAVTGAFITATSYGWKCAAGFIFGTLVALLNFIWLRHGTNVIVERAVLPAMAPSKSRLLLIFSLRYAVVIAVAYVIVRGSTLVLYGFLAALALPFGGAVWEAICELARALHPNAQ